MMNKSLLLASAMTAVAPRAFANAEAEKPARIDPILTGTAKIALPERKSKRGSESKYPFAALTEAGMAFGVKNKTAAQLSSIVSNANRKALQPKLNADGTQIFKTKEIKAADGTVTNVPTQEAEMEATAHYFAFDVTDEYRAANTPAFAKGGEFEGSSVLVFRDK
jgi:hypothetical protein